jgi:uncharacterized SAM-binding protein YcdF (DUF218 family)
MSSLPGQAEAEGRHRMRLRVPFSRIGSRISRLLGLIATIAVVIAFVGIPSTVVRWMTFSDHTLEGEPSVIVVLGGGGVPSESGLIRTYYGAEASHAYPEAEVIVSLPTDLDPETSSVGRMRDELVMRGVPSSVIKLEHKARNTHEQAEAIRDMLGLDQLQDPVLLVTSPSHMRRSVLSFQRAGFHNVAGLLATNVGHEADPGAGTSFRYGFWNTLSMEIHYLRECVALLYYRARGWI